jgi:hypothetical protein
VRAWVRVYGKPARWYRSLADAAEDGAVAAPQVPSGEPVAVAWEDDTEQGQPRYLVVGPRGSLSWQWQPRVSTAVEAMVDGAQSRTG